jgi:hypothetical protein
MPIEIKITEEEINNTPNDFELGKKIRRRYFEISNESIEYDRCVICGKETQYRKDLDIMYRVGYIEGAGQTCPNPKGCQVD